nr:MAG TPA: hypothetical protein [Caudoviricetes sp.]
MNCSRRRTSVNCPAYLYGHFLCPYYIHIGGCHSVNQHCPDG